ncbi:MAG: hypothetical protein IJ429_06175 [Lachnospiraceae bacterium]|nr:hypothetical protein [Lachnospiraceae bacterium]
MKRWIVPFLIIFSMFFLVGCEDSNDLEMKEMVYGYELLPCMSEIKGDVTSYKVTEDAIYIASLEWADESNPEQSEKYFYKCSPEGTVASRIPYEPKKDADEWLYSMEVSEKGELILLYSCYSEDSPESRYVLRIVGEDGTLICETDIAKAADKESVFIYDMKKDKSGKLYLLDEQAIYIMDTEGKLLGSIEDEQMISNIIRAADGEILAGIAENEKYTLKRIDADEFFFSEVYNTGLPYYSITSFGDGLDYDFYYTNSEGVYGYNLTGSESKKIIDFVSSNLNSLFLGTIKVRTAEEIIAIYGSGAQEDPHGLYRLVKKDPKDVVLKETITYYSLYSDEEAKNRALAFNKSQDKYQVVVKDYSLEEDPAMAMHKDFVAGNVPDIMDLSGVSSDKYMSEEYFADLYEFMESDPDIRREDFMENVLSVMETDGKLYRITPTFAMNGLLLAEDNIKAENRFSFNDLTALEEKGSKAFYMETKTDVLSTAMEMNYNDFIDWGEGKCEFDSEKYISVLQYADTYPSEDELVWDENVPTMTAQVKNEKILAAKIYNMSMMDLQLYEEMFERELSFVGFPSDTFSGGALSMDRELAICAKSSVKKGAWEFLKTYLSREYISGLMSEEDFFVYPIRKDSMEDKIQRYSATEAYTDAFGNEMNPISHEWGYEDIQLKFEPLNEKRTAFYRRAIEALDHRYVYDSDVIMMVQEEAEGYFKGEISAAQAAANTQERVSVYMEDYR